MSVFREEKIGDLVIRINAWNPVQEAADNYIRYVDLSSVDSTTKSITDCHQLLGSAAPSRARQLVAASDILVSTVRPNLNGVAMVPAELDGATASTGFCVLRPNLNRVYPKYLFQWIKSPAFIRDMVRKATGASYPAVSDKIVFESKIPLPTIEKQRRIATVLDAADMLGLKRRATIGMLDPIVQSMFVEIFGDPGVNPKRWPAVPLAEAVNEGTIVTYGIVQAGEECPGGVPYIRTGDIVDGKIVAEGLRHTTEEIASRFTRSRVTANDIVMSIRATVGTTAVVPEELDGANLTQGTAKISPGKQTELLYLLNYLRAPAIQSWIGRQVKGATFREITLSRLRELPVLLPPRDLQKSFVARATAVERLKSAQYAALRKLESLYATLQHDAFKGEL